MPQTSEDHAPTGHTLNQAMSTQVGLDDLANDLAELPPPREAEVPATAPRLRLHVTALAAVTDKRTSLVCVELEASSPARSAAQIKSPGIASTLGSGTAPPVGLLRIGLLSNARDPLGGRSPVMAFVKAHGAGSAFEGRVQVWDDLARVYNASSEEATGDLPARLPATRPASAPQQFTAMRADAPAGTIIVVTAVEVTDGRRFFRASALDDYLRMSFDATHCMVVIAVTDRGLRALQASLPLDTGSAGSLVRWRMQHPARRRVYRIDCNDDRFDMARLADALLGVRRVLRADPTNIRIPTSRRRATVVEPTNLAAAYVDSHGVVQGWRENRGGSVSFQLKGAGTVVVAVVCGKDLPPFVIADGQKIPLSWAPTDAACPWGNDAGPGTPVVCGAADAGRLAGVDELVADVFVLGACAAAGHRYRAARAGLRDPRKVARLLRTTFVPQLATPILLQATGDAVRAEARKRGRGALPPTARACVRVVDLLMDRLCDSVRQELTRVVGPPAPETQWPAKWRTGPPCLRPLTSRYPPAMPAGAGGEAGGGAGAWDRGDP